MCDGGIYACMYEWKMAEMLILIGSLDFFIHLFLCINVQVSSKRTLVMPAFSKRHFLWSYYPNRAFVRPSLKNKNKKD